MTAPPQDQHPWLSLSQAAKLLDRSSEELLHLVVDGHLRAHRLPDGTLVISTADIAALRTPVPASEAVNPIIPCTSTDSPMQQALDASVAALAPIQERVPADATTNSEMGTDPSDRIEAQSIIATKRPRGWAKYAPPSLHQKGDVVVGFRSSDDAQVAKRILECVSLLRGWGRQALASQNPDVHVPSKVA